MSEPSSPPPLPPATESSVDPKPERSLPAWRWWMFLIILGSYPLVLGLAGQFLPAPTTYVLGEISGVAPLAREIVDEDGEMARYLNEQLDVVDREKLNQSTGTDADEDEIERTLVALLNSVINGPSLHATGRFNELGLSGEANDLIESDTDTETDRLNRLLLEEAFPTHLRPQAGLQNDPKVLGAMIAETMIGFGLFFGIAWAFGRVTKGDLFLNWRNLFHWKPWVFGGVYSVAMRFVIGLAAMAVIFGWAFFKIVGEGGFSPDRFTEVVEETSNEFRPRVETLVDQEAIGESPAYLIINVTIVSFLLAGFREELWRAGVLGGLKRLHPTFFGTRKGQVCAVLIAAVIFGIGHLPMGVGAVVMTGGLGVLLGLIMVFHNNIWHAVIAHGFFNASTFIFLHLIQRYSKSFEWLEEIRKSMGN